jgi:hypothetical protein
MHKQVTYDEYDNPHVRLFHDGIEYYDGKIQAVYHSEGRYVFERWEDGSLKRNYHEYMIRDHLGNTRVRFADLNGDKKINIVNQGPGQEKEILGAYHLLPKFTLSLSKGHEDGRDFSQAEVIQIFRIHKRLDYQF